MVASIALFFSLVAINNIVDLSTNFAFVGQVTRLNTTFLRRGNVVSKHGTNQPLNSPQIASSIKALIFFTSLCLLNKYNNLQYTASNVIS